MTAARILALVLLFHLHTASGPGPGATPLHAQAPEEAAVLAAVEALFQAMAERDAELLETVLLSEGQLVVVQELPDGTVRTAVTSHEQFIELVGAAPEPIIERFWEPEVLIHGPLAVVWTPYDLYVGQEFSHCGVDAFTLVRTEDGWRISGGSYTVEPQGCPPSPLGPLDPD